MARKRYSGGFVCVAFGAGLLLASCFPAKFLLMALAGVLILLGLPVCKSC